MGVSKEEVTMPLDKDFALASAQNFLMTCANVAAESLPLHIGYTTEHGGDYGEVLIVQADHVITHGWRYMDDLSWQIADTYDDQGCCLIRVPKTSITSVLTTPDVMTAIRCMEIDQSMLENAR
jgi:hypothetical protein